MGQWPFTRLRRNTLSLGGLVNVDAQQILKGRENAIVGKEKFYI